MSNYYEDTFADNRMPRTLNRANVLSIIIERGLISRVDIARLSGLNQSTVSRIVSKLIEEGIIFEDRKGDSALGRKPINIKMNIKSRIIGIIVVNPWTTDITVCDLGGGQISTKRVSTITEDPENFLAACTSALETQVRAANIPMAGVSVTVPGMVDPGKRFIFRDPYLGWENINVGKIVRKKFDCEVFLECDVKAATLAEICFAEETQTFSSFLFVMVDVGVWSGLAINQSVYSSFNSLDGQLGSNLVLKKNSHFSVGGLERLDNLASETSIVGQYHYLSGTQAPKNIDNEIRRVIWLAMKGDEKAVRVLKEAAGYLGVGLASIDNILNPERIIVAGKVTRVWELIAPEIIGQIKERSVHSVDSIRRRLIPSSLVWPSYEGASALVLRHFLGGYRIVHRQQVVKDWQTTMWESWENFEKYEREN